MGDVLLVEVWVVLGVVVEVVADGNADGRWIGFFERDGEMVWHLVLSRRHSLPLVGYCPPPPHRPRRPRRPRRIINACRIGSFLGYTRALSISPFRSHHVLRRPVLVRHGQATHEQKQQPLQRNCTVQHGRGTGRRGRGRSRKRSVPLRIPSVSLFTRTPQPRNA